MQHLGGFVEWMGVQHGEVLQGVSWRDSGGDDALLASRAQGAGQVCHGCYHILRDARLALQDTLQVSAYGWAAWIA